MNKDRRNRIIGSCFLGGIFILAGIYGIFNPLYDTEHFYNMNVCLVSILVGVFICRFGFKKV